MFKYYFKYYSSTVSNISVHMKMMVCTPDYIDHRYRYWRHAKAKIKTKKLCNNASLAVLATKFIKITYVSDISVLCHSVLEFFVLILFQHFSILISIDTIYYISVYGSVTPCCQ